MTPTVEAITMFYNDEFLVPFYCKHYAWVDKISALVDKACTDKTLELLSQYNNVEIVPFEFPDGMDDIHKAMILTAGYQRSQHTWVMMVDSDEFIFTLPFELGIHAFLEKYAQLSDVVVAKLYQVYRHVSDVALDPEQPPLLQRRHGDKNTNTGENGQFNKPLLVRTGKDVEFHVGNHLITAFNEMADRSKAFTIGGNHVYGAHWCNADPCFCIERRLRAKDRQSQRNLQRGLSIQHHFITRESVLEECVKHLNDEQLF